MPRLSLHSLVLTLFCASAPLRPCGAQFHLPRPKLPSLPGQSSGQSSRMPTFDDRVVEITDARLTALMRGLEAEKRQRATLEAGYRQNADARAADAVARRGAEGRDEQVSRCFQQSPEYQAIYADTGTAGQARMAALSTRIQSLQAKGDYAAIQTISDSVTRASTRRDSLLTAARARCAAVPQPKAPTGPPPAEPSRPLRDSLQVLGAAGAGLAPDQYSVMRERVLAFMNTSPQDLRNSMYVYSPAEMRALQARRSDLGRYQEQLTED